MLWEEEGARNILVGVFSDPALTADQARFINQLLPYCLQRAAVEVAANTGEI